MRARAAPSLRPWLAQALGAQVEATAAPDPAGWLTLTLTFDSLERARASLLPFGGALEVLDPPALRLSLADFGQQIAARYAAGAAP